MTLRALLLLVLLFLLVAMGLGCGPRAEPAVVRSGDLEIRAQIEPPAARVGANEILVELRDAAGTPIEDAALEVAVRMHAMGAMPAMGGPAEVDELGDGRYRASFELEMGGTWQLEVAARPPAGALTRAEGALTVGTPGLQLRGMEPERAAEAAADAERPGEFRISPARLQQTGVRSAKAERRSVTSELRALGRVAYDETALHDVTLKVPGFVGELHVDAVGDRVERGQVLFTLYSPELYAAQREYRLAREAQERARASGSPERADYLVAAARNRLRLWDLADRDLERIATSAAPIEYLPIRSPARGYVVEKNVVAGGAVAPGAQLYRIAPLDRVWVEAEVYEEEIALVAPGMRASVELPALPGRRFEGTVAWVYPGLDARTRTLRLRVELANEDEALRPDMLAHVRLESAPVERLMVPLSAVLYAGDRSFVFLDLGGGRLRPARVRVGVRVGEEVEILEGVAEGQAVVASATFLVASESRLRSALDRW